MVRSVKQQPARHQTLLISLLVIILVLGVAAYFVQRDMIEENIAGEAIRKSLAIVKDSTTQSVQAKTEPDTVRESLDITQPPGQKADLVVKCPPGVRQKEELFSDWDILLQTDWKPLPDSGYRLVEWQVVGRQCARNTITCTYSDQYSHTKFMKSIEGVNLCFSGAPFECDCYK